MSTQIIFLFSLGHSFPGLMLQWAVFKHIQALYRDLCPCMHVLLGACYVQVGYRVLLFGSRAHDIFTSINHL